MSAPILAVQRRIDNYRLPEAGESWPSIAQFVRDTVTSLDLRTVGVTSHYLCTAARFTFWAWQSHGVALDAEEVFRLDLVAMFNEQKMRNLSDTYRAGTAQRLSRLVAHTSKSTPASCRRRGATGGNGSGRDGTKSNRRLARGFRSECGSS